MFFLPQKFFFLTGLPCVRAGSRIPHQLHWKPKCLPVNSPHSLFTMHSFIMQVHAMSPNRSHCFATQKKSPQPLPYLFKSFLVSRVLAFYYVCDYFCRLRWNPALANSSANSGYSLLFAVLLSSFCWKSVNAKSQANTLSPPLTTAQVSFHLVSLPFSTHT